MAWKQPETWGGVSWDVNALNAEIRKGLKMERPECIDQIEKWIAEGDLMGSTIDTDGEAMQEIIDYIKYLEQTIETLTKHVNDR